MQRICLLIIILCTFVMAQEQEKKVTIVCKNGMYTPLMSSIVGISLTPKYSGDVPAENIRYYWHTDFGILLSHSAKDNHRVRLLGTDWIAKDSEAVYWSFDIEAKFKAARVVLMVIDISQKKVIGSSVVDIDHFGNSAVVKQIR